ncbi:hypothetical protein [Pseudomonas plecoglossicida]|uniref:hypothetical protein n=1 Tax=Pseudomonas plecoglossicida TaxID=70775 RepID=UPI0021599760|nr:hypothetical protein [Pseudomonas plecoglossicida]
MPRPAHSKKEIEQALRYAEAQGWRVVAGGGHCWGKIYCPYNSDECRCGEFCVASVWSTPKNPETFARQILRIVDNCVVHRRSIDHAGRESK